MRLSIAITIASCFILTVPCRAQVAPAVNAPSDAQHVSTELPGGILALRTEASEDAKDAIAVSTSTWQPFDLPTIGVQAAYGAVGGSLFVAGGYGILKTGTTWDDLGYGFMVMYFGTTLIGTPLGVYLGGESAGGNGSLLATFAGGAAATGILVATMTRPTYRAHIPVGVLASLLCPIVAYHLSASPVEDGAVSGNSWDSSRSLPAAACDDPYAPHFLLNPTTPQPDVEIPVLSMRF